MTSIGEQLRHARELRGLSLDQIADDTNIARRFLNALENEDFAVFPGDPYILGFLRNYAEYLALEPETLINAFRGIRLQEQPVPLDALLHDRKRPNLAAFIIVGVIVLVAIGVFLLWNSGIFNINSDPVTAAPVESTNWELTTEEFEHRLYTGDTVSLKYSGTTHQLRLAAIGDRVALETPNATLQFMMGEEGTIDLDKDNLPELSVFVIDFSRSDPTAGCLLRITAQPSLLAEGQLTDETGAAAEAPVADLGSPENLSPEAPGTPLKIIYSGRRSPHPFVLNITFRNQTMFRHEIDRNPREERFFFRGDEIVVTATNTAKLWSSNAAGTRLVVQASGYESVEVELGQPGVVTVNQLRWTRADDGSWSLGLYALN
ncbi:MAG: hypothetical protein A2087_03845 [Spirochaetes bacterium GWD1_61_31]|nr:MAG: hypothetical protein A2Y37_05115 [Spirochaetes bacterium GWB1_60_80]OHD32466.1 MAG: hypothetical protein A2004_12065 [Spirochaetes bacterium GWC1_61_12]OHD42708.1 MAG: hypothetical protein A2087_03845 [Spirochaetes bacterium GWD1_61_31]OHD43753.1 MAG: hypothetical protein A2Y35_00305 [Spirochaetes bacterium GWE1_60_18]OHD60239.1 MAG: hypothetical protein A2Y32_07355 [Spirochaetes bacterium GWF1_60_12]HAP44358.1 hypothetical protein [Spirochaetaceae bacterium]